MARPYLVIAGLVCTSAWATLIGSALLTALHLPQDAIRWAALLVLTLIGLGLTFPPLQYLIERPFVYLPQRQIDASTDGPGRTSQIGPGALVLTATFALGNALPLLAFATTLRTSWCSSIGLDPLGNVVGIVCTCCLRDLQIEVLRQVGRIRSSPHAYCLTCGAPVRQLSHALRVTQLRQ